MTTPAFPSSSNFSDNPVGGRSPDQFAVRLSHPGELFAAVPALLGFRPEHSIVAVCLSGRPTSTVGAVMRHDLILGGGAVPTEPMSAVLKQFGAVCEREKATGVLLLLVDDRFDDQRATSRAELAAIVEEFEELLESGPTELIDVLITAEIASGCEWLSLLAGGAHGAQTDPSSSHVAVAQVLGGRAIRSSRGDLEATIESGPALERMQIAALIDGARETTALKGELAERAADPGRSHRRELESVLSAIARLSSGERLLAPDCAELARALDNVKVRDSALALAVGACADEAEQLWILLARNLPDPERANAAVLLGYSAYVRGDGPLAGIALGAALDSDPGHVLATLLDGALQSGLRPTAVRDLAVTGYECAKKIGVGLPPPIEV
ncbi:DUF4192 domain-containing protein [Rhodococcus marinonascens]|uniref:DUF4192 domain-containing protein n=1 Tax=Rhodococcus marinonascens TaxID=38311 RepID=UPI0009344BAF|nr:DUF4192 domain-containing protein [Rhodococcus marinonascens]